MTHDLNPINWPPQYVLKRHRKARHVKFRVDSDGLQITIPYRFNLKELPFILEERRSWIMKHLASIPKREDISLPQIITLPAMNETWRVRYENCPVKFEPIEKPNGEIVLIGNETEERLQQYLLQWIRNKAANFLLLQLKTISLKSELYFERLIIRDQKTLWGSCTSKKSISLNYKLVFLPLHLMQHVLIHELCHTKHLNHSQRFWNLVAAHDGNWEIHKAELRKANRYIPHWVNYKF